MSEIDLELSACCNVLLPRDTATHCNALQHRMGEMDPELPAYSNMLLTRDTATHCNTHCNTQQRTAACDEQEGCKARCIHEYIPASSLCNTR